MLIALKKLIEDVHRVGCFGPTIVPRIQAEIRQIRNA